MHMAGMASLAGPRHRPPPLTAHSLIISRQQQAVYSHNAMMAELMELWEILPKPALQHCWTAWVKGLTKYGQTPGPNALLGRHAGCVNDGQESALKPSGF